MRIASCINNDLHQWTRGEFQPTMLLACANTPLFGGGMKIAPQAKLDDGKLDLCRVKAMSKVKFLCLFPSVYWGKHLNINGVEYSQAERVCVETEVPIDVYADGEYVCRTPVEFGVARGALRVIHAPWVAAVDM
jgi:diacylglycerol kinase family enzyme